MAISPTRSGYRLVLEYCEAGTLRSHLNTLFTAPRSLSLDETQSLLSDILSGLSHLHSKGFTHGDLKPENILLTHPTAEALTSKGTSAAQLTAKLSDFGSAREIAQAGSPHFFTAHAELGSPTYTAPERFAGRTSPLSDLYSVGVILYELLLGDRPFSGTAAELQDAHRAQPVPLPDNLTGTAKQLFTTALHKDPRKRFQTATDMLAAIQQLPAVFLTAPEAHPLDSPVVTFPQALSPIPSNGITAPVQSLLKIPQGCCIVTDRSLHVLTRTHKLMSMARFDEPHWIAVSPDGRWFTALPKIKTTEPVQRQMKGMVGLIANRSGHQRSHDITLSGPLLTELCTRIIKIIALDSQHILRVRTNSQSNRTFLETFTHQGEFVGEQFFNFPIAQITPTAQPHQLVALTQSTPLTPATVLLINVKTYQVRHIRLPIIPAQVSPLPWGYIVTNQRRALLLDSTAQPLSWLNNIPHTQAIAAITPQKLLLSTAPKTFPTKDDKKEGPPTTDEPSYSQVSSLLTADLSALDIGLIF